MAKLNTSKKPTNAKVRVGKVPRKGLTFDTLMSVRRIGKVVASPIGTEVAWVVATPDVAANTTTSSIWRKTLPSGEIREVTPGPGKHHSPAYSPDGKSLVFVSTRNEDEGGQLWVLPLQGGEARQVTHGYGGAGTPVWNPDSQRIAFQRDVVVSEDYKPKNARVSGSQVDPKTGPSSAEVQGLSHPKSSAKVSDSLLFRHWDTWRDRRRHHIFIVDLRTGKLNDLTPFDCDTPPISLGSDRDFDFDPSGTELAYVMNPDEVVARSTNNSIFIQKIRGISAVGEPVAISTSDACDNHPRYSPDGQSLLYLAMNVPGYEADRCRVKVYDRKSGQTATNLESFDRSPETFVFAGSAKSIDFIASDRGYRSIYRADLAADTVVQLTQKTYNTSIEPLAGTDQLLVTRQSTTEPADLFLIQPGAGFKPLLKSGPDERSESDTGTTTKQITHYRQAVSRTPMNEAEEFWGIGADRNPVHGFLVRPAGFNPRKKYPLILLIHGGPQSAFGDDFHYRWNAQHFASTGAVVAYVNPRGSTGYGQKFTDQISGDWGGRCYKDIMQWLDQLLDAHSFLDPNRVAAAGASFGGFMVNWICGHTDRFKGLVCHDGIFNAETMAYTTEELWFDEHEHGGLPHENRKPFLKFSPHLSVQNFKTPTLVIQGGRDYRCPDSEGLGMYTALQVMNVPSRFLYFPDEGHWVMQLANAQVWYEEVLGWLSSHLGIDS